MAGNEPSVISTPGSARSWQIPVRTFGRVLFALLVGAVPASAQPLAYVTHPCEGGVSVFDTQRHTVIGNISVPHGVSGVAVDETSGAVVVTNNGCRADGIVSIIDATGHSVFLAYLLRGFRPYAIAMVGPRLVGYVGHVTDDVLPRLGPGKLGVVGLLEGLREEISLPTSVVSIAVDPGARLAGAVGGPWLTLIDATSDTVIDSFMVGDERSELFDVAFSPDGRTAYVTDLRGSVVSVIDTEGRTVVASVDVPSPLSVAITPDGTAAYVTTLSGVCVLDTVTNTVSATVPLPETSSAGSVAVTPDGRWVYVLSSEPERKGAVFVIDTSSNSVVRSIALTDRPGGIAIGSDGQPTQTPTPTDVVPATSSSPTPTLPPEDPCPGDCDGDEEVTVDEVVTAVRIAKDQDLMGECPPCDVNRDRHVTVDELVAAVRSALTGCAR
jgi:YVTN family beta-propeller protein